jgi:hypothetical protein
VRARISLAAILIAFACFSGVAYAGPGDVYNDFAADGQLSCNHSRADLRNVLRSGSINQYGDPYTLAGLKLAVRRQLAGGCRKSGSNSPTGATAGGGKESGTGTTSGGAAGKQTGKKAGSGSRPGQRSSGSPPSPAASAGLTNGGNGAFVSERVLVAGLLAGGLAIGGWLTRRALTARS